jgi:mRNA-degrading endonuclease toxin of MazEF toxin-antitoxin module
MVDKIVSVPRPAIDGPVGRCSDDEIGAISNALRRWLEL